MKFGNNWLCIHCTGNVCTVHAYNFTFLFGCGWVGSVGYPAKFFWDIRIFYVYKPLYEKSIFNLGEAYPYQICQCHQMPVNKVFTNISTACICQP